MGRIAARMTAARALAAAGVLALSVAGCGGSGGAGSSGGAGPVATTAVDLPPSYRFAPTDISVAAGATVTWTNHDNFTHSVAFRDGGLPADPKVMKPGETATFTFTGAGTFHYQCSFHPQNMQGTVVVTAP